MFLIAAINPVFPHLGEGDLKKGLIEKEPLSIDDDDDGQIGRF
jgi:hypothetical protein